MKLKGISAVAVSSICCAQLALAKTAPLHLLPDTATENSAAEQLDLQLELITDSINFVDLEKELGVPPIFEYTPFSIEGRLAALQKTVPLDYNDQVRAFIDIYSTDRYKRHLSQMMGLAQYYFPIYEQVFAETGVPDEIKYLSIVESALNPHAVSRVGATGLWQFMFTTARAYNLSMDSYIDERKDPVAASYAAASYLLDAYHEFGDWLLAIASYNCGKGNVLRAIERSGLSNPDYWAINRYLPRETRKYVPAFIAVAYMLGYHEEHGIEPAGVNKVPANTETVWVQKFVPFNGVARALEIDEQLIQSLNPAYKRGIVNGSPASPKRLVLPEVQPHTYSALYAALNNTGSASPKVLYANQETTGGVQSAIHRVRKGETLGGIANRYGVTVQDLRAWNNIKRNVIVPGQSLQIQKGGKQSAKKGSNNTSSSSYITYRVRRGDTLSTIAERHRGASVSSIKAENGLKSNHIKPGMNLKIKVG